jgi:hypothetical protein
MRVSLVILAGVLAFLAFFVYRDRSGSEAIVASTPAPVIQPTAAPKAQAPVEKRVVRQRAAATSTPAPTPTKTPIVRSVVSHKAPAPRVENLLFGGDFESPGIPYNRYKIFSGGQQVGCGVATGTIYLGNNQSLAASGQQSLGVGTGGLKCTIEDTVPGQLYEVSFMVSGNPAGRYPKKLRFLVNGGEVAILGISINSFENMGWEEVKYQITASGGVTVLEWQSLTQSERGPALDNIKFYRAPGAPIVPMPTPAPTPTPVIVVAATLTPAPTGTTPSSTKIVVQPLTQPRSSIMAGERAGWPIFIKNQDLFGGKERGSLTLQFVQNGRLVNPASAIAVEIRNPDMVNQGEQFDVLLEGVTAQIVFTALAGAQESCFEKIVAIYKEVKGRTEDYELVRNFCIAKSIHVNKVQSNTSVDSDFTNIARIDQFVIPEVTCPFRVSSVTFFIAKDAGEISKGQKFLLPTRQTTLVKALVVPQSSADVNRLGSCTITGKPVA